MLGTWRSQRYRFTTDSGWVLMEFKLQETNDSIEIKSLKFVLPVDTISKNQKFDLLKHLEDWQSRLTESGFTHTSEN